MTGVEAQRETGMGTEKALPQFSQSRSKGDCHRRTIIAIAFLRSKKKKKKKSRKVYFIFIYIKGRFAHVSNFIPQFVIGKKKKSNSSVELQSRFTILFLFRKS